MSYIPTCDVSRSTSDLCWEIRSKFADILKRFRSMTGNDLVVTCTYRSAKEQKRLYSIGRTTKGNIVTHIDGVTKKSKHNFYPSKAVDVAVVIGGKVSWNNMDYEPLGIISKDLGLDWGGNWKNFKDYPHIEVP